MNIPPTSAAANIAGVSLAATKGGESDKQSVDATAKQTSADKPAGKPAEVSSLEAGSQTGDRGGDGRQVLDTFERHNQKDDSSAESESAETAEEPPSSDGHLDLEC